MYKSSSLSEDAAESEIEENDVDEVREADIKN